MRSLAERTRLLISLAIGLIAGTVIALLTRLAFGLLLGWIATAVMLVCWVWLVIGRMDSSTTSEFATREDGSRVATRWLLLIASSFSLVGVLYALAQAGNESGGAKWVFTGIGISTVVISWA
ncbi:MAG TPA: DUF1345 domain-containing protein, partial [Microthrixaceae bacterium]|nr:DUF1345 domain-containing protein [Microthrixaceae bacterium]